MSKSSLHGTATSAAGPGKGFFSGFLKAREQEMRQTFSYNYSLDKDELGGRLADCVHTLSIDEETAAFLASCETRFDSSLAWLWDLTSLTLLRPFFSSTTVNALAFRGKMFILSTAQFAALLDLKENQKGTYLDIGAGDGGITSQIGTLFDVTHVTETNPAMRMRLGMKGYTVFGKDDWQQSSMDYDVISCLNVLDRCDRPLTLLASMRRKLKDGGKLLIALVLPYSPFVDEPGRKSSAPAEYLQASGVSFEEKVENFVTKTLEPLGFHVTAIARGPYLCQGDMYRPYYLLHDVVVVAEKA